MYDIIKAKSIYSILYEFCIDFIISCVLSSDAFNWSCTLKNQINNAQFIIIGMPISDSNIIYTKELVCCLNKYWIIQYVNKAVPDMFANVVMIFGRYPTSFIIREWYKNLKLIMNSIIKIIIKPIRKALRYAISNSSNYT